MKTTLTTHELGHPMMKCGHAANATDESGNPICVICALIDPGSTVVDDNPPDLSGRMARCWYRSCRSTTPSNPDLAFFEHRPKDPYDTYYCGCLGWN